MAERKLCEGMHEVFDDRPSAIVGIGEPPAWLCVEHYAAELKRVRRIVAQAQVALGQK